MFFRFGLIVIAIGVIIVIIVGVVIVIVVVVMIILGSNNDSGNSWTVTFKCFFIHSYICIVV